METFASFKFRARLTINHNFKMKLTLLICVLIKLINANPAQLSVDSNNGIGFSSDNFQGSFTLPKGNFSVNIPTADQLVTSFTESGTKLIDSLQNALKLLQSGIDLGSGATEQIARAQQVIEQLTQTIGSFSSSLLTQGLNIGQTFASQASDAISQGANTAAGLASAGTDALSNGVATAEAAGKTLSGDIQSGVKSIPVIGPFADSIWNAVKGLGSG